MIKRKRETKRKCTGKSGTVRCLDDEATFPAGLLVICVRSGAQIVVFI